MAVEQFTLLFCETTTTFINKWCSTSSFTIMISFICHFRNRNSCRIVRINPTLLKARYNIRRNKCFLREQHVEVELSDDFSRVFLEKVVMHIRPLTQDGLGSSLYLKCHIASSRWCVCALWLYKGSLIPKTSPPKEVPVRKPSPGHKTYRAHWTADHLNEQSNANPIQLYMYNVTVLQYRGTCMANASSAVVEAGVQCVMLCCSAAFAWLAGGHYNNIMGLYTLHWMWEYYGLWRVLEHVIPHINFAYSIRLKYVLNQCATSLSPHTTYSIRIHES